MSKPNILSNSFESSHNESWNILETCDLHILKQSYLWKEGTIQIINNQVSKSIIKINNHDHEYAHQEHE